VRSLTADLARNKEWSRQRRQERGWGVARDTEVPHGALHLGSPTGLDVNRDVQAMSVRDVIKHARANAASLLHHSPDMQTRFVRSGNWSRAKPVNISYITTPSDQISTRKSCGAPEHTSGAQ
jgi:hypothetical protein